MNQPSGIQIIQRSGGLTGGAHVALILVSVFTCGFGLVIYLLAWGMAPVKRVDVVAPAGTPMDAVERARAAALVLTPQEKAQANQRIRVALGLILAPVALLIVIWLAGR